MSLEHWFADTTLYCPLFYRMSRHYSAHAVYVFVVGKLHVCAGQNLALFYRPRTKVVQIKGWNFSKETMPKYIKKHATIINTTKETNPIILQVIPSKDRRIMFSPRKKTTRGKAENKERKRKGPSPMFIHRQNAFSRRSIEAKPYAAVGTWFVGPKAENSDIFTSLMNEAIESHFQFRRG